MTISVLFLAGRFLFAVPFVMLGADRLGASDATPAERGWGALGILGAAGVVLGAWGDVAALVLGVQVLGAGVSGNRQGDAESVVSAVGLLGAALVVFAVYTGVGDALEFTITDPIVNLDLR